MEQIAKSTRVRPVIVGLATLVPWFGNAVSTADNLLRDHVERARQERLNSLIEALEEGLDDFAGPIAIQRADVVLHAAYVTIEATLRTSRREKIRAFAKLLLAGLAQQPALNLEHEHDDYLKILDDLSVRELVVLATLREFEQRHPRRPDENGPQWTSRFWDDFCSAVCDRAGIPHEELSGLMSRLVRTGTFEPFVGAYWDYTGGRGQLTATYYRLAAVIETEAGTFDTGKIL